MMSKMPQILSNERGAAVIELAIVAPILAMMVIGVADMSIAVGRKLQLEQAAHRALEKVLNTTGNATVEDTIKNEAVCQVNGTNPDGTCSAGSVTTDNVTVSYRLECNDSVTTDEDCAEGETRSRWLSVQVTDKYTPLFPVHFSGIDGDGTYHLSATAGMRVQ